MTAKLEVYKCEVCGNIIEVLHSGAGTLVCCGQDMVAVEENTMDAAVEKHVPAMSDSEHGTKISVGSVAHPMEAKHYIEWIEAISSGKVYRQNLEPGENPEAVFCLDGDIQMIRAYCNIHGLWKL